MKIKQDEIISFGVDYIEVSGISEKIRDLRFIYVGKEEYMEKIDDIIRNGRQRLYTDYLEKDVVSRIELEFRSELCEKITLNSLLDRSYIFNIFLSYIGQYTNIFNGFKFDVTKLNVSQKRASIYELIYSDVLKIRYVRNFLGYGKNIIKVGACPVDILIRNNYIGENTKKDIVLSIKDGVFRQDIYEFLLLIRYSKDLFNDYEDDNTTYITNQYNYD